MFLHILFTVVAAIALTIGIASVFLVRDMGEDNFSEEEDDSKTGR